ncbi:MAG: pitrilysin family protein, partial [Pirellulaceae bacterium]|nr:pitrilysin family protein [Pirellulaceae bacterium]
MGDVDSEIRRDSESESGWKEEASVRILFVVSAIRYDEPINAGQTAGLLSHENAMGDRMRVRIGWEMTCAAMCLTAMIGSVPIRKVVAEQTLAASSELGSARLSSSEYQVLQERPDRLLVELPNRLLVIAQELQTAPVVSAQVWIKTGSIYEQDNAGAGLSHFLEHLVSGGTTKNRSEAESNAILGSIGAQTNAGTGLSTVQYYVNTTAAHAAEAIELLSDWMQHSVISGDEFHRERDVIQREFQMGQGDPRRVLWKLTQTARYRFHPARYPTIGYLDEFLRIGRDEIYEFYRLMYVPNNMVFVVVGAIDKQQIVDQIARLWADSKPGDLPDLKFPIEPPLVEARHLAGTADIKKSRLRLAWPGTRLGADGDYALDLLGVVLGQG